MDNEKISIVGVEGKLFNYDDVKSTIVKINGLYYKRNSPDLIRVRDARGKLRFFREKSPLVVKLPTGEYAMKSLSILTEDGIWLDKNSPDVVKIGDKYHRRQYCTKIQDQWYLLSSPDIVMDCNTRMYILKKDAVTLSPKVYGNKHTLKENTFEYAGEHYNNKDARKLWSFQENKLIQIPAQCIGLGATTSIVVDFQDKTNPQEDRVVHAQVWTTEVEEHTMVMEFVPTSLGAVQYRVPKALESYFQNAIDTYIIPRYMTKSENVRKKIIANFSDMDENENTVQLFKVIPRPYPGKSEIFRPSSYPTIVKSKSFKNTGGLKYSFGVEFETSQGLLSNQECEDLNLFAVGDRSIGAGEYVTSPLVGDAGIAAIEKMCKALNKSTLVDDRCGIHVHVGTIFKPTAKKPEPAKNEAPSFNKEFLINSIRLGALIEPELYSAMPKNRKPTLYHCHSIRRFGDINDKNFDTYLGAYIFGPKELWYTEDKAPIKPFDFAPYKLGRTYNANHSVGTWAEGRYKWLNLIHSYTRSSHRTIEFRIFSATTVFDKVYAYIMTSLAFTYVADNCPNIIKPGITLSQMFEAAFSNSPDIVDFLTKFYEDRKKKFNRGELYPTNHPYLKFN